MSRHPMGIVGNLIIAGVITRLVIAHLVGVVLGEVKDVEAADILDPFPTTEARTIDFIGMIAIVMVIKGGLPMNPVEDQTITVQI